MGNVLNAVCVNLQQVLKRNGTLNSDSQITALEKTAERGDFLCMQISAPNLLKYFFFFFFLLFIRTVIPKKNQFSDTILCVFLVQSPIEVQEIPSACS